MSRSARRSCRWRTAYGSSGACRRSSVDPRSLPDEAARLVLRLGPPVPGALRERAGGRRRECGPGRRPGRVRPPAAHERESGAEADQRGRDVPDRGEVRQVAVPPHGRERVQQAAERPQRPQQSGQQRGDRRYGRHRGVAHPVVERVPGVLGIRARVDRRDQHGGGEQRRAHVSQERDADRTHRADPALQHRHAHPDAEPDRGHVAEQGAVHVRDQQAARHRAKRMVVQVVEVGADVRQEPVRGRFGHQAADHDPVDREQDQHDEGRGAAPRVSGDAAQPTREVPGHGAFLLGPARGHGANHHAASPARDAVSRPRNRRGRRTGLGRVTAARHTPRRVRQDRPRRCRDEGDGVTAVGRVADRYELVEQRGRGGLGRVWAARDSVEDREVAVKLLHGPPDEAAATRFVERTRAAAPLDHPDLVAVSDVGLTGDGTPFLVTELLTGRDLRTVLREGLPELPAVSQVLDWTARICAALDHAHRAGVVHGDLKPADLFLTADGGIRVLDLGLADRLGAVSATGTALIGTLAYTAPERLRGRPAEPAADLYALGCVLHELLTGTPPFAAEDIAATVYAQLEQVPEAPDRRRPDVPPHVSRLVLDLLAKDPAQRPPTAAEVARRLTDTTPPRPEPTPTSTTVPPTSAEVPPTAADVPPASTEAPATPTEAPLTLTKTPAASAEAPPTPAEAPPVPGEAGAASAAPAAPADLSRRPAPPPLPPAPPRFPPGSPAASGFAVPAPSAPADDDEAGLRRAVAAGDPDAAVQLAYHLADTGREAEAEALYRDALARNHPEAANDLADLLAAHDRHAEAEELYRRALVQGHPDAANNLGRLLLRLGRAPEAEHLFRHAAARGHDDAGHNLGLLLANTGRLDEAEQWFRHTYAQGHPDATVNLAGLLAAKGRMKEADKLYRRALTEGHRDASIGYAGLYERRGRVREAEEMYRRALAEGHPAAPGQLARFLDTLGRGREATWPRS
ncbi:hypothetical protein B4N89_07640 [Embleya scabrispora]|uniref:non-specific serine/threonine protein kinase n=1 Tax=Embleya scabrispora TaxID=159449 RepID=A0A1T3NVF9_9ACTN|nr:hypothetical protein B4N89_07640 [Embleya scabrispora]